MEQSSPAAYLRSLQTADDVEGCVGILVHLEEGRSKAKFIKSDHICLVFWSILVYRSITCLTLQQVFSRVCQYSVI